MLKGLRNTWEDSTELARMEGNCDVTCFLPQRIAVIFTPFFNAHEDLFSSSSRFSNKKRQKHLQHSNILLLEWSVRQVLSSELVTLLYSCAHCEAARVETRLSKSGSGNFAAGSGAQGASVINKSNEARGDPGSEASCEGCVAKVMAKL